MEKLSIIVPVYNEEKTLVAILNKIKKVRLKNIKKEIVIVDDASTDHTKKILLKLKESNIKILSQNQNQIHLFLIMKKAALQPFL